MKKFNGNSIANIETKTGALPKSFGFSAPTNGSVRRLTKADLAQQERNLRAMQGQRF